MPFAVFGSAHNGVGVGIIVSAMARTSESLSWVRRVAEETNPPFEKDKKGNFWFGRPGAAQPAGAQLHIQLSKHMSHDGRGLSMPLGQQPMMTGYRPFLQGKATNF